MGRERGFQKGKRFTVAASSEKNLATPPPPPPSLSMSTHASAPGANIEKLELLGGTPEEETVAVSVPFCALSVPMGSKPSLVASCEMLGLEETGMEEKTEGETIMKVERVLLFSLDELA